MPSHRPNERTQPRRELVRLLGSCNVELPNEEANMAAIKATWFVCAFALLGFVLSVPLSVSSLANDADIRKAAPQIRQVFLEAFAKQDVASIVAGYTSDAVSVTPAGVQEINAKVIEGWFANGPRKMDTTFDQALPLSADTALGIGTFRLTGTTLKGEPVEVSARWANTYVRQDGQWKIRLQTMIPSPPPPK